ncbi:GGDEF domain-containing protein [Microvirga mediterraneensis]|uniref:diguanylate cyclase n=1 Tax=Microvirga mediterraneensis TaxID=2754695 RepID=A0A838BT50_9HYPH|nr:GGDEF domain-containing protein [Microvirga mediterraneensis]MBA1159004.1 GGDEF domain-containing protein [Microvirga mediterraneensis]
MDGPLHKRRRSVLSLLAAGGLLCVGSLWWFETATGIIAEFDRYAYPALMLVFICSLVILRLFPKRFSLALLGCYFGASLYFVAAITTFTLLQAQNNLYIVANTLQWMPLIYVAAFVLFQQRHAIVLSGGVFLASVVPSCLTLLLKGPGFWSLELGALLINAGAVHLLVILSLSFFTVLHAQFEQARVKAAVMESSAHTDPLTGVANRRGMEAAFRRIQADPAHSTVLVLLDVDYFKSVNDRFGHYAGDEVLRWVASSITSQLRPGDLVGRWGGEEFVIAAPNTSLSDGVQLAERIRQVICAKEHLIAGPVTISAGLAAWTSALSVEEALRSADHALYLAKANGRNRIEAIKDPQVLRPLARQVTA